jgi:hypothetical protein
VWEAALLGEQGGPPGNLVVSVTPFIPGTSVTITADNADAGDAVYFALSTSGTGAGPCPAPLAGYCLDIVQPALIGVDTADSGGRAEISVTVPATFAGTVWIQAAMPDGAGTEISSAITVPVDDSTFACYPGASEDWSTCVELVDYSAAWGADYDYPAPYLGSPLYEEPVRYVDLAVANPSLSVSPNFVLSELMQEWKGRYGVFQPFVVAHIQDIRDWTGGALNITSGYRNVTYNASVGGSTHSRHMYGDCVDMYSSVASLTTVGDYCTDLGAGYIGYYTSHVHCDWRDDDLNEAFFDASFVGAASPGGAALTPLPEHSAQLIPGAIWTAPGEGWDEGEPLREWTALDITGGVIEEFVGDTYVPPAAADVVEVWVGRAVHLSLPVP